MSYCCQCPVERGDIAFLEVLDVYTVLLKNFRLDLSTVQVLCCQWHLLLTELEEENVRIQNNVTAPRSFWAIASLSVLMRFFERCCRIFLATGICFSVQASVLNLVWNCRCQDTTEPFIGHVRNQSLLAVYSVHQGEHVILTPEPHYWVSLETVQSLLLYWDVYKTSPGVLPSHLQQMPILICSL